MMKMKTLDNLNNLLFLNYSVIFLTGFLAYAHNDVNVMRNHVNLKDHLQLKIYLFNYTNAVEFLSGQDDKLKLQEIGPYVYQEIVEKVNPTFEGNFMTFQEKRTQTFDQVESGKFSEDDELIIPNVPVISLISSSNDVLKYLCESFMEKTESTYFKRPTVGEALWGYNDPFLGLLSLLTEVSESYGFLKDRKEIGKTSFTVNINEKDLRNLGILHSINEKSESNIWLTDTCNSINGSLGHQFPPELVAKKENLEIFVESLCRKLPFVYEKNIKYPDGITANRYKLPKIVFDPNNLMNECYNVDSEDFRLNGIFSMKTCNENLPLIVSLPHFYSGDAQLFNHIEGLQPSQEAHESFIDVHLKSGISIKNSIKLQINVLLKKENFKDQLKSDVILPLYWLDISINELSSDKNSQSNH